MTPTSTPLPVIVIGAGLAGWTTVREFRRLDSTTPVLLITADSGDFYAKPTLSNAFAQNRAPAQLVTTAAAKMVETLNITLLAHTPVQAIDATARTVTTAQGVHAYRALVLATGALPIRLPLEGHAAAQVLSVNSLTDFAVFHAALTRMSGADTAHEEVQRPRHAVVMGAGLIGCEFTNDLATVGYRVTVVDPSPRALAALLPEGASAQLQAALSNTGGAEGEARVQWCLGRTVLRVDAAPHTQAGQAPYVVTLSDGQPLHADVVLSAIGLRADTRLALAAGITCARGIVVDAQLQTSAHSIYALGDSAQYGDQATGRTLPYVMPIMHAAKALAATLAGQPTEVKFPPMPVAIKTPALPLVVAAPAPGTSGGWVRTNEAEPGSEWHWLDGAGVVRGFVLAGAATPRRGKLVPLVVS
jgi:rubredoxin---NAD+ reductase